MEDLCGCELEDDRIERLVPSEEQSGGGEDDDVHAQDNVPGVPVPFLRQVYRDEVRTPGRGVHVQA